MGGLERRRDELPIGGGVVPGLECPDVGFDQRLPDFRNDLRGGAILDGQTVNGQRHDDPQKNQQQGFLPEHQSHSVR
jgi:hypothetical protein